MERPTVLVVEDDEATLELLATALREDYRVFVARNAEHALAVGAELGWAADLLVVDLALGEASAAISSSRSIASGRAVGPQSSW